MSASKSKLQNIIGLKKKKINWKLNQFFEFVILRVMKSLFAIHIKIHSVKNKETKESKKISKTLPPFYNYSVRALLKKKERKIFACDFQDEH